MIVVQHDFKKVTKVNINKKPVAVPKGNISEVIMKLCQVNANQLLVWIHETQISNINTDKLSKIFHHNRIMLSYASTNYFGKGIGYIEDSPFININREVSYPTWQMNSLVGGIHTSVLNAVSGQIKLRNNFDYFLNSLAKLIMPQGIFCYSEPRLLLETYNIETEIPKASTLELFQFTAEHYRRRWTFLLLLNFMLFEKKLSIFSYIFSFFFCRKSLIKNSFKDISVESIKKESFKSEVDVIIPTIGRKAYLYDVLKDFSKQSILPKRIIIVEQDSNLESESQLDYIYKEKWPFQISHKFIHLTGACNARNLALEEVKSEWTFLADDDIRFNNYLIEEAFNKLKEYSLSALTTSCYQANETNKNPYISQTTTFGAGYTFVKTSLLNFKSKTRFGLGYEFGYGEDIDFGMQLRNKGCDIVFTPKPDILHLKAPIGGFRTKFKFDWENEDIQPKPSPTILLYKLLHVKTQQLNSYKLNLFLKSLNFKNLLEIKSVYRNFKLQWGTSLKWAKRLKDAN